LFSTAFAAASSESATGKRARARRETPERGLEFALEAMVDDRLSDIRDREHDHERTHGEVPSLTIALRNPSS
jgi:hypothetical protein